MDHRRVRRRDDESNPLPEMWNERTMMTRSREKPYRSYRELSSIAAYLRSIIQGSIQTTQCRTNRLLPYVTSSITLFSVNDIPAIIRRNEYSIDDMMGRIDGLEKSFDAALADERRRTHCEYFAMLIERKRCSRVESHIERSIAFHNARNSRFTIVDILLEKDGRMLLLFLIQCVGLTCVIS